MCSSAPTPSPRTWLFSPCTLVRRSISTRIRKRGIILCRLFSPRVSLDRCAFLFPVHLSIFRESHWNHSLELPIRCLFSCLFVLLGLASSFASLSFKQLPELRHCSVSSLRCAFFLPLHPCPALSSGSSRPLFLLRLRRISQLNFPFPWTTSTLEAPHYNPFLGVADAFLCSFPPRSSCTTPTLRPLLGGVPNFSSFRVKIFFF